MHCIEIVSGIFWYSWFPSWSSAGFLSSTGSKFYTPFEVGTQYSVLEDIPLTRPGLQGPYPRCLHLLVEVFQAELPVLVRVMVEGVHTFYFWHMDFHVIPFFPLFSLFPATAWCFWL